MYVLLVIVFLLCFSGRSLFNPSHFPSERAREFQTPLPTRPVAPIELVLFTTEDSFANTVQKLSLFRDSSAVYRKQFRYRCIVFTNNPSIIQFFKKSVCTVITTFKRNPFGLPYIFSMYSIATKVFKAKYYGYLNSDILIEPTVFSVLKYLDQQARAGVVSPYQELAGRVHPVEPATLPMGFSNITEIEMVFADTKQKKHPLRKDWSADYFLFSSAAIPIVTNSLIPIVIGRAGVDNILIARHLDKCALCKKLAMIDGTEVIYGIHIGVTGYKERTSNTTNKNKDWNLTLKKRKRLPFGTFKDSNFQMHSKEGQYEVAKSVVEKTVKSPKPMVKPMVKPVVKPKDGVKIQVIKVVK